MPPVVNHLDVLEHSNGLHCRLPGLGTSGGFMARLNSLLKKSQNPAETRTSVAKKQGCGKTPVESRRDGPELSPGRQSWVKLERSD
jgi:hypothetical protein